mmetsp:Transcript_3814/g.14469  ORF Transcript_3814/g.14469 Transcript_3814/m.14469 type:complete len:219 (+) Transcript_3814:349-1005(+)
MWAASRSTRCTDSHRSSSFLSCRPLSESYPTRTAKGNSPTWKCSTRSLLATALTSSRTPATSHRPSSASQTSSTDPSSTQQTLQWLKTIPSPTLTQKNPNPPSTSIHCGGMLTRGSSGITISLRRSETQISMDSLFHSFVGMSNSLSTHSTRRRSSLASSRVLAQSVRAPGTTPEAPICTETSQTLSKQNNSSCTMASLRATCKLEAPFLLFGPNTQI